MADGVPPLLERSLSYSGFLAKYRRNQLLRQSFTVTSTIKSGFFRSTRSKTLIPIVFTTDTQAVYVDHMGSLDILSRS